MIKATKRNGIVHSSKSGETAHSSGKQTDKRLTANQTGKVAYLQLICPHSLHWPMLNEIILSEYGYLALKTRNMACHQNISKCLDYNISWLLTENEWNSWHICVFWCNWVISSQLVILNTLSTETESKPGLQKKIHLHASVLQNSNMERTLEHPYSTLWKGR